MAITRSQTSKTTKPGLYANINAKKKRIAAGSGETMRKVGSKGSPAADAFVQAAKTAKKVKMAASGGKISKKTSNNMGLFGRK